MDTKLIALKDDELAAVGWPFGAWWTGKLIRDKKLGCIRVGRRVFVTRELIEQYYAKHVEAA